MIGIITAFRHELAPLLAAQPWRQESYDGRSFYRRQLQGCGVVATSSGLGKVMAASTSQLMISRFQPLILINVGSCGGVAPHLKIGDQVLASSVVEYDFASLHKDVPRLQCAPSLVEMLADRVAGLHVGPVASADQNADTPAKRAWLHEQFQALAADWEGAAVVRVARRNGLPALVLRGVTDVGSDELEKEFSAHVDEVLPLLADTMEVMLEVLAELIRTGVIPRSEA